jgi:hypothetical protein
MTKMTTDNGKILGKEEIVMAFATLILGVMTGIVVASSLMQGKNTILCGLIALFCSIIYGLAEDIKNIIK